jgi:hypothetical protein
MKFMLCDPVLQHLPQMSFCGACSTCYFYEQAYEFVFNENSIFRWSDRHATPSMVLVPLVLVTYRRHAAH